MLSAFSTSSFLNYFDIFNIAQQTEQLVINLSELVFQGVVLFAINVAITIGFAMGLTRALNAGVEGAGSFWSRHTADPMIPIVLAIQAATFKGVETEMLPLVFLALLIDSAIVTVW